MRGGASEHPAVNEQSHHFSWPKAPSRPIADGLDAARRYVATPRPESLEWGPVGDLGADVMEGIRAGVRRHEEVRTAGVESMANIRIGLAMIVAGDVLLGALGALAGGL